MKKIYTTLFLLTVAIVTFSQPYYVFTAQGSGPWSTPANWNTQPRLDGVSKHKVVIPAAYNIVADNAVNGLIPGDVEIHISGSLTLSANTILNLTSNSSVRLNSGTIYGTTTNQRILIGTTVKYRGNVDGAKTGLSIADNTTGVAPNGFRDLTTLPVNFTSFYINKSAQTIQLSWSTDNETNNSHFEVERSSNGTTWEKIAVINAGINSNNSNNYSYNDKTISGPVVYYRLRQVDMDGRSIFSSIRMIRSGEVMSAVKIYGTNKKVVVDLNTSITNSLVISVVNANGQVITQQTVINPSYKINIDVPGASKGVYVVHLTDSKGWTEVKKVVL